MSDAPASPVFHVARRKRVDDAPVVEVLPPALTQEQLDVLEDALVDTIVADVLARFQLDTDGQTW